MVVSRDIHSRYPASVAVGGAPPILTRTGTLRSEALSGEEEAGRRDKDGVGRTDNADNAFVEEVSLYILRVLVRASAY